VALQRRPVGESKTQTESTVAGVCSSFAIGGAAQFYARSLPKVHGVYLLDELGVPEAMCVFEARDFPAIVTMDAHGNSLHEDVASKTGAELEKIGAR
jgi:fumarate hydratase class I